MKTLAIACLVTLAAATSAAAQTGLQLGVRGDAAIASVVGSDVSGWQSRTSVGLGGVLVWQPSLSPIGFETGLSFVSKGGSAKASGTTTYLKIGYIEVPALLRLAIPLPGSKIRPVADLGVVMGLKTGCTMELSAGGVSASADCKAAGANLKTFDLGVSAGVGLDVPVLLRFVIRPSVSYTRGLATIDNGTNASDVKNSVVRIGVEFRVKM